MTPINLFVIILLFHATKACLHIIIVKKGI
nr:MAG TPA: hypothetical protein [Caudoviricetes sp.]